MARQPGWEDLAPPPHFQNQGQGHWTLKRVNDPLLMTKTQHSPLQLTPGDYAASLPGIKVFFCPAAGRLWAGPLPTPLSHLQSDCNLFEVNYRLQVQMRKEKAKTTLNSKHSWFKWAHRICSVKWTLECPQSLLKDHLIPTGWPHRKTERLGVLAFMGRVSQPGTWLYFALFQYPPNSYPYPIGLCCASTY